MIPGFMGELLWLASTVYMEARGEPYEGKLAVAHVIMNRCNHTSPRKSVSDVVLKAYQFSAWNTTEKTRTFLDTAPEGDEHSSWGECYKAATSAFFNIEPDATKGSRHYLNVDVTKKIRGGSLPSWFDESKVTLKVGRHTFLKL